MHRPVARVVARVVARPAAGLVAGLVSVLGLLAGCLSGCGAVRVEPVAVAVAPPPAHARWDYQLGGARSVPADVAVVTRDREAAPVPGRYNVCYVNAFQTQDSEAAGWRDDPARWRLVLKDRAGRAVVDSGWGEWLLDTRTSARRTALAAIVGRWIDGCAAAGFDAVEPDNLDSFSRSKGLVTKAANVAFARLLIARAHADGLAIAQKNTSGLTGEGPALGFDFAVAEECGQYRECAAYTAAYGAEVLAVEYTDAGFARACAGVGDQVSVVRRDRDVTPQGVRRYC